MVKKSILVWLLGIAIALPIGADELVEKAKVMHERLLTIDTHCDTTMSLQTFDMGIRHEPGKRGSGKQDLIRMREGGLDASFFAVFVGQGALTPEAFEKAHARAVQACDNLDKMFQTYPDLVQKAIAPEDAERIAATGKRAIFIGMENGYPLGNDLSTLDYYYQRGIRYITICHSADNQFCDSSTDRNGPEDRGLSGLGRELVRRMNRMGILIDISHLSPQSISDVLAETKAPVFASHSSCRALCDHPRDLSDDQLRALKKNGGVVQICLVSDFLKKSDANPEREKAFFDYFKQVQEKYGSYESIKNEADREQVERGFEELNRKFPQAQATLQDIVDHIDHVVKVIGIDHVGIGSDFDGGGGTVGCDDVTEMPNITIELLRRGYSEKEIARIWGGNFLRVFRQAVAFSRKPEK